MKVLEEGGIKILKVDGSGEPEHITQVWQYRVAAEAATLSPQTKHHGDLTHRPLHF